jgi:hypothetical protein
MLYNNKKFGQPGHIWANLGIMIDKKGHVYRQAILKNLKSVFLMPDIHDDI